MSRRARMRRLGLAAEKRSAEVGERVRAAAARRGIAVGGIVEIAAEPARGAWLVETIGTRAALVRPGTTDAIRVQARVSELRPSDVALCRGSGQPWSSDEDPTCPACGGEAAVLGVPNPLGVLARGAPTSQAIRPHLRWSPS